ncbi:MAG: M6 family metalloprotease domain-containing protein [Muribaculum sp.]|nr:M6 family metalloprotease domain-containing protein [Muribaculum sp.]
MKNNRFRSAVLAMSICSYVTGLAVPAKPGIICMNQPDGTALNVKLVGDERFHYYLTEDDYLLVENNGRFYYASTDSDGKILNSGIQASPIESRTTKDRTFLDKVDMVKVQADLSKMASAPEYSGRQLITPSYNGSGLFSYASFPSTGEQKGLVILVQYSDLSFSTENPHSYFSRMVNEEGFSDYGGTGSARDYYLECSGGLFSPTFDVFGPVTLPQTREFYGANNSAGKDLNPGQMILDACALLDNDIDFTQYDRDGDGYVDNVFVFYAGMGEASGGGAESIWPHSWTLEQALGYIPELDGLKVNRYACANEWQGSRPDGVGTFVHEFSHVMGLPDLYATATTGAFTPGRWSVMDYGPYNNDGCTPPLFSAFERNALGWLDPVEIKEPKSATLNAIGNNEAYIIKCGRDSEYFILENRQNTGWDTYLPGHGMLIWHIDYAPSVWDANKVNNLPDHQYVDIEEADGTKSEESRGGDAFPGTARITSFTDDTTPSMVTWTGTRLGLPITNIAESADGIITFDVAGGRPEFPPVTVNPPADVTPESFMASWSATDHACSYQLSVYSQAGPDAPKTYIVDHFDVGLSTSYTVTGLEASTTYYYYVNVVDFVGPCADSETMEATTAPMSFEYTTPLATEASEIDRTSFTANWEALDEADNYLLDVYTKLASEPKSDICDFTGGVDAIPQGWTTNVTATDGRASFSGKSAPALRMSTDGAFIQSPEYAADIVSLGFWHRGSNVPAENSIKVEIYVNSQWLTLADLQATNDAGGKTTDLTNLPEGTRAIRISFVRTAASGTLALDDIEVLWDMAYDKVPVDDYIAKSCGTSTSCHIDGLQPLTDYYYTVTAISGTKKSKISNEVKATTLEFSGIDAVEAPELSISVADHLLIVTAPATVDVKVYDLTGRFVGLGKGLCTIELPGSGVYIVKADGFKTNKIIIK